MKNPRIDRNTRVIVQGMTGRAGRMHTRLMRAYGRSEEHTSELQSH